MGAPQQMIGTCNMGSIAPITVNIDWGTTTGSTSTITSSTRTLTIPSGNPGLLLFNLASTGSHIRTTQYSKSGGAFTTFLNGATLSVANTNTLAFQMTGATSPDGMLVTVNDNTTSTVVGSSDLERS